MGGVATIEGASMSMSCCSLFVVLLALCDSGWTSINSHVEWRKRVAHLIINTTIKIVSFPSSLHSRLFDHSHLCHSLHIRNMCIYTYLSMQELAHIGWYMYEAFYWRTWNSLTSVLRHWLNFYLRNFVIYNALSFFHIMCNQYIENRNISLIYMAN